MSQAHINQLVVEALENAIKNDFKEELENLSENELIEDLVSFEWSLEDVPLRQVRKAVRNQTLINYHGKP